MTTLTTSELLEYVQRISEVDNLESQSVCAELTKGELRITAFLSFEKEGRFWFEGLHHERKLRTTKSILREFPDQNSGFWIVVTESEDD